MKRTEIAMIILIASAAAIVTFFTVNSLLGGKIKQTASIEQVKAIDSHITKPTKRVFNNKAINPTVEVYVQTQGDASTTEDVEQ